MTDMRKIIDLMEAALAPVGPAQQGDPLEGNLDMKGLAKFLPDVDDMIKFTAAVMKVRRGQLQSITRPEMTQLALAFISLMRDGKPETMQAMRRLMTLYDDPQR
jgi:hypothetical protein